MKNIFICTLLIFVGGAIYGSGYERAGENAEFAAKAILRSMLQRTSLGDLEVTGTRFWRPSINVPGHIVFHFEGRRPTSSEIFSIEIRGRWSYPHFEIPYESLLPRSDAVVVRDQSGRRKFRLRYKYEDGTYHATEVDVDLEINGGQLRCQQILDRSDER